MKLAFTQTDGSNGTLKTNRMYYQIEETKKVTEENALRYQYNDAGRALAGYKGNADDCVVRAIAIATDRPYQDVYDDLKEVNKQFGNGRSLAAKMARKDISPRNGSFKDAYHPYLISMGFKWVACMHIGKGCAVHMRADELPAGTLIVQVSKHLTCVKNGVLHDMSDCTRFGTRCVYGYYII